MTQTKCQFDAAVKSPEVANPPACAAYYTTGSPPYPTPQELPVYVNPSIWNTHCGASCSILGQIPPGFQCCNTLPGFGSGHLSVAEAERMLKSDYILFHSKSGSLLSYRWMGRTTTITETFCSATFNGTPQLNIHARNDLTQATGVAHWVEKPGSDSLLCADVGFKLRNGPGGAGVNWQWADPAAPVTGSYLPRVMKHEAGHARGLIHQACAAPGSPSENDHTATTGGCAFDSGTPPSGLIHEPIHMADQRYARIDYGVPAYHLRHVAGLGFGPTSWAVPQVRPILTGHKIVSAVSAADSNGPQRGFAYNVWDESGFRSRLAVTLYENSVWKTESGDPGGYATSWSRPDISRSLPSLGGSPTPAGHSWIVAFQIGATPENSGARWPNVVEKPIGGASSSWIRSDLKYLVPSATLDPMDNISGFDSIAVTYDPISQRFLLAWIERENNAHTADTEVIKISTRTAANIGGMWDPPQVVATTRTSDGADIACSPWKDQGTHAGNCILVWAHPYSGQVLSRRFTVGANGTIAISPPDYSFGTFTGPTGYHRPAVTVNPMNTDPKFLMSYSDWNSNGQIYVAKMNRGSMIWVQDNASTYTLPSASKYKWFGPAGLGTYVSLTGTPVFTDLLLAY